MTDRAGSNGDGLEDGRYYTVNEVAALLSVNPKSVRVWVSEGRLHGYRIGAGPRGRLRIDAADVQRLLQSTELRRPEDDPRRPDNPTHN